MRAWKRWCFFLVVGVAAAWAVGILIAGYLHNRRQHLVKRAEVEIGRAVIPKVDFADTPFREAMDKLVDELKAGASGKWSWRFDDAMTDDTFDPDTAVTLRLYNVPAAEAVAYTVILAGASYEISGIRGITVFSGERDQERITRRYELAVSDAWGLFPKFVVANGSGPFDVRQDMAEWGVDFKDGDAAWFDPSKEKLVVTLSRVDMDFVEVFLAARHLTKDEDLSLVQTVSALIERIRDLMAPGPPPPPAHRPPWTSP